MSLSAILIVMCTTSAFAQFPTLTEEESHIYAQQLIVKAMTQSFLGYHDKAIVLYEEALSTFPSSATLNSSIAESYEHMGEYSTAIFHAQQALSLDREEIYFHRHLARLYLQTGEIDAAAQQLQGLLVAFPNDIEALQDLSYIHQTNGDFSDALAALDQIISVRGADIRLLEERLELQRSLNHEPGVEQTLIQLEKLNPSHTPYIIERALLYSSRSEKEQAIALLEEAAASYPTDAGVSLALAQLYEETGDPSKADALRSEQDIDVSDPQAAYLRAEGLYNVQTPSEVSRETAVRLLEGVIDMVPEHEKALTLLGTIHFESGSYAKAATLLEQSAYINPRNRDIWVKASQANLYEFNPEQSATIADEALLLFPGQPALLYTSAMAHMNAHNYGESIDRFTEYIELAGSEDVSQQAEARSYLGLLYGRLGQIAASDSVYTIALQDQDKNPVVLHNKALSLAERGAQLSSALEYALDAIGNDPNNSVYMGTAGWIHFQLGQLDEAENWFLKATSSNDPSAKTFEHFGDLLLKQGKSDEAIASWNKSLELDPNNTELLQKLKLHAN